MPSPTVHVLFENPTWLPPLEQALRAEGFDVQLHDLAGGTLDPSKPPPPGIWWNRMSPSAHTRGHGASCDLMREVLGWLEAWGARVINGRRTFELEVSKFLQDVALRRHGILTPRTLLAVGREQARAAARSMPLPFITKHNQGGKGLGIELFWSADEFERWLDGPDFDPGPHGQLILQEYIQAAEPFITRVELVGGRMILAMRSSTHAGFQLCPSDACQAEKVADVCPADGAATFEPSPLRADDPLVLAYGRLCADYGFDIAGIEFVEDSMGRRYTYDINGNTNYNQALGDRIGVHGMAEAARWLRGTLQEPATAAIRGATL